VAGAGAAAAFAAGGMGAPGVLRITAVANLLVAVWIALILTRGGVRGVRAAAGGRDAGLSGGGGGGAVGTVADDKGGVGHRV